MWGKYNSFKDYIASVLQTNSSGTTFSKHNAATIFNKSMQLQMYNISLKNKNKTKAANPTKDLNG